MQAQREDVPGIIISVIWVSVVIFFGLYENNKIIPPRSEKKVWLDTNLPKPQERIKVVEIDLSRV